MQNHYLEIVTQQLKMILESGLYDTVDNIYIGCLGNELELKQLQKVIEQYNKIKIVAYSSLVTEYEFHTLRHLKRIADNKENHYGLYIHAKTTSYPRNHKSMEGGLFWVDYMNYFNISKWQSCIDKLDIGYDTCGVKWVSARKSPSLKGHYSGNFFWYNSEYVKSLKPVDMLNTKDRWEAEMYIGLNSPLSATLCQYFCDYNTKGKFSDFIKSFDNFDK